jgi:hypothetical protein
MASFKNSRPFCVVDSIVTLFFLNEKNGENRHNFKLSLKGPLNKKSNLSHALHKIIKNAKNTFQSEIRL